MLINLCFICFRTFPSNPKSFFLHFEMFYWPEQNQLQACSEMILPERRRPQSKLFSVQVLNAWFMYGTYFHQQSCPKPGYSNSEEEYMVLSWGPSTVLPSDKSAS